jgi:hypothetical protein
VGQTFQDRDAGCRGSSASAFDLDEDHEGTRPPARRTEKWLESFPYDLLSLMDGFFNTSLWHFHQGMTTVKTQVYPRTNISGSQDSADTRQTDVDVLLGSNRHLADPAEPLCVDRNAESHGIAKTKSNGLWRILRGFSDGSSRTAPIAYTKVRSIPLVVVILERCPVHIAFSPEVKHPPGCHPVQASAAGCIVNIHIGRSYIFIKPDNRPKTIAQHSLFTS